MYICIHIQYTYIHVYNIYIVLVKSGDGVMTMHNMICIIDIMCKYCKSVYAVYIYVYFVFVCYPTLKDLKNGKFSISKLVDFLPSNSSEQKYHHNHCGCCLVAASFTFN